MKEFKKIPEPPAGGSRENAAAEKKAAASGAPAVNAGPEALRALFEGLQQSHGNAYVQRVVSGMEPAFADSVEDVRIHTGPEAAAEAERQGARAFTQGKDIYFGAGQYAPETEEGRKLLGHELAHVVQQRRAGEPADSGTLETEADAAGMQAAAGARPQIAHSAASAAQRKEKKEEPSVARHPVEILPVPPSGAISAAGRFSIAYSYGMGDPVVLTLQVPAGVSVAATPMAGIEAGEYRVADPGGGGARTVGITVASRGAGPARLQVAFVQGSATYLVVFQFLKPSKPAAEEPAEK